MNAAHQDSIYILHQHIKCVIKAVAVLTPSVEIKLDVAALAVLPLRLCCALLAVPRPPLGQVDPQRGLAGEDDGAEAGEAAEVGGGAGQQQQEPDQQPRGHPAHLHPASHGLHPPHADLSMSNLGAR